GFRDGSGTEDARRLQGLELKKAGPTADVPASDVSCCRCRHCSGGSTMTVDRLLFRSARITPDKVALIAGTDSITYEGLERLSCRLGRALLADGIRRGDRVGLILPNCIEFIASFFAVSRIGAVLVPLNPAYTDAELAVVLADAGVRLVLCRSSH